MSGLRISSSWLVTCNELKQQLGSFQKHNEPSRANESRAFCPALMTYGNLYLQMHCSLVWALRWILNVECWMFTWSIYDCFMLNAECLYVGMWLNTECWMYTWSIYCCFMLNAECWMFICGWMLNVYMWVAEYWYILFYLLYVGFVWEM